MVLLLYQNRLQLTLSSIINYVGFDKVARPISKPTPILMTYSFEIGGAPINNRSYYILYTPIFLLDRLLIGVAVPSLTPPCLLQYGYSGVKE